MDALEDVPPSTFVFRYAALHVKLVAQVVATVNNRTFNCHATDVFCNNRFYDKKEGIMNNVCHFRKTL